MISGLLLLALAAEPTVVLPTSSPLGALIQPGVYGELRLARDPATKRLTGHFSSSTGEGKFSCIFQFEGKPEAKGNTVQVESWFPAEPKERIAGTLTVTAADAFSLTLKEEHGGCWNVQHFADAKDPATFSLDAAKPWVALRVVKQKKAKFFSDASAAKPKAAFLVIGDVVGVLEQKGEWLSVEFVGERTTTGWMPKSAFF